VECELALVRAFPFVVVATEHVGHHPLVAISTIFRTTSVDQIGGGCMQEGGEGEQFGEFGLGTQQVGVGRVRQQRGLDRLQLLEGGQQLRLHRLTRYFFDYFSLLSLDFSAKKKKKKNKHPTRSGTQANLLKVRSSFLFPHQADSHPIIDVLFLGDER
jgi:hypothetical protein